MLMPDYEKLCQLLGYRLDRI